MGGILFAMLIVANWKAYVDSVDKAKKILARTKRLASIVPHDLVLAPPPPFLGLLAKGNRSKVSFAAQDVSTATGGANTGEVTAGAICSAGATYSIVGHSERRALGDDNTAVSIKLQHILAHGLVPIVCVGERHRDEGASYLTFLREEIASALAPLSQKERATIVLAYEPIWAIGKTAADSISSSDLTEMISYIRKVLTGFLSGKSASRIRILYGGSVEADNALQLSDGVGIDGFLVGHASAEPESFAKLVMAVSEKKKH